MPHYVTSVVTNTHQLGKLDDDLAHSIVKVKLRTRSLFLQRRRYIRVRTRLPLV